MSLIIIFFYVGTPSGVHLFGHLLWPIFQTSIFTHYIIQFFKFLQIKHERFLVLTHHLYMPIICRRLRKRRSLVKLLGGVKAVTGKLTECPSIIKYSIFDYGTIGLYGPYDKYGTVSKNKPCPIS